MPYLLLKPWQILTMYWLGLLNFWTYDMRSYIPYFLNLKIIKNDFLFLFKEKHKSLFTKISFSLVATRIRRVLLGPYQKGVFSVGSMYKALSEPIQPVTNIKFIWKMKIPLKTKIFAWYLRRRVILTIDNLVKRNWYGCTKCVFCHKEETIKHLFFRCQFARSIWSII
jgi:hypothetical protein